MNRIALITAILVVGYGGVIFGKEIKLEIPQEIGTIKHRPRAPQKVNEVIASYENDILMLTFSYDEGISKVEVTSENGSVYTYSDYSNAPIVISWTSNEPPVYISVVTETGNTYEGAFE
jgi:hypothetical protein